MIWRRCGEPRVSGERRRADLLAFRLRHTEKPLFSHNRDYRHDDGPHIGSRQFMPMEKGDYGVDAAPGDSDCHGEQHKRYDERCESLVFPVTVRWSASALR